MTGWDVCYSTWKTTYIYLCNRRTYPITLAVPSTVIKEPLANSSLSDENSFNADLTEFGKRLYKAKDIRFVVLPESNNAAILTSWKCKYKYSKLPRKGVNLSKGRYVQFPDTCYILCSRWNDEIQLRLAIHCDDVAYRYHDVHKMLCLWVSGSQIFGKYVDVRLQLQVCRSSPSED